MAEQRTIREALNAALLIHAVAWSGIEMDGKTARVGCFCGWEGNVADFEMHCRERAQDG